MAGEEQVPYEPSQLYEGSMPRENINSNHSFVVFDESDDNAGPSDENSTQSSRTSSLLDRARLGLARFGRLSGMRIPGVSYTALSNSNPSRPHRIGGGIGQDGVFSNMNAKPEASHGPTDPNDRGDDDDLVCFLVKLLT